MRVLAVDALRVREVNLAQCFERALAPLLARKRRVRAQALLDLRTDAHGGVERAHRLLKHDADVFSLNRPQLLAAEVKQLPSVQTDRAADVRLPVVEQSRDGHGRDGLAGAGLAHKADDLTVRDGEADPAHGFVIRAVEPHMQIADFQHIRRPPSAAGPRRSGSRPESATRCSARTRAYTTARRTYTPATRRACIRATRPAA